VGFGVVARRHDDSHLPVDCVDGFRVGGVRSPGIDALASERLGAVFVATDHEHLARPVGECAHERPADGPTAKYQPRNHAIELVSRGVKPCVGPDIGGGNDEQFASNLGFKAFVTSARGRERMTATVVVLGAGYAGAGAIKSLEESLDDEADLIWISEHDYH